MEAWRLMGRRGKRGGGSRKGGEEGMGKYVGEERRRENERSGWEVEREG